LSEKVVNNTNWKLLPLGDAVTSEKGKKPKNIIKREKIGYLPYVDIKAFEKRKFTKWSDGEGGVFCDADDILIVWDGARSGLTGRGVKGYVGSTITKLTPKYTTKSYLYYFLMANYRYINTQTKGVGIPHVDPTILWNLQFPIPSKEQQNQIVDKIESLFTQLDAGVESLHTAKTQLKRHRQSVLKHAFEGKLTEEWRENKGVILESAEVLLQKIKSNWDTKTKKRYKALPPIDSDELGTLPPKWKWVYLSELGELNRGRSRHRPRNAPELYGGKYPFIQTGEVRACNTFIKKFSKTYNDKGLEQSRLWQKGTLCITIAANIADTGILTFDACFPDSVVGFSTNSAFCDIRYIEYYFRKIKSEVESGASATAQKNINLTVLSKLPVPLPPVKEQYQISQEIEKHFSIADNLLHTVETETNRSNKFRQSILKSAFQGKLISQDDISIETNIRASGVT